MSFENLIKIIGATLLNSPTIKKFREIKTDPKKVQLGDLFIATDRDSIDLAIQNGAYGILFQDSFAITDKEIAWIRVDDIKVALIKLLRYRLIDSNLTFFYLDGVEFDIVKTIAKKDKTLFLSSDISYNFHLIMKNLKSDYIVLSSDLELLLGIYPDFKILGKYSEKITIIKESLFTTTLIYNDRYYIDLHISSIFLDSLSNTLGFLNNNEIEYNLENIHPLDHFHPIFITKNLTPKSFGDTQRVLIVESNDKLIDKELNFLKERVTWAKIATIRENLTTIKDIRKLEVDKFYFILIKANYNQLIKFLKHNSMMSECSLFGAITTDEQ